MLTTIRDITRQVEKKYSISLESDHFLATFTLHLKNLILRNQNGSHLNNPIKDDLRQASPFLYDVALHIIAALQQAGLLTRPVDEDETSFIVLHLYAEIERQNQSEKYVRCLLVIPNYLRVEETICQKLLSRFGDQIVLTRRSALSTQAMEPNFDFLVTTLKRKSGYCSGDRAYLSTSDRKRHNGSQPRYRQGSIPAFSLLFDRELSLLFFSLQFSCR